MKIYENPDFSRAERIAALNYDYDLQPKEDIRDCNLCGADQWTIITHRDRYGFSAQTTACGRCGLVMLNPRMTAAAYQDFYNGVYRPLVSAFHGRRIDAKTIQLEQQDYAREIAAFIAPYLANKRDQSFLDVGGSTGIVAAHFTREFDLNATVLDPAADEIAEAESLGIETITAFAEDWEPGDRKFALIGMFQTVDHLLDVMATLKKLRSFLSPNGLFVIDIVDFRAAYLKNWSTEAATKIDHPYYLTEETFEVYLACAGFKAIRKAYSADHHLVAYICKPFKNNPEYLPSAEYIKHFFREIRWVQNAPHPGKRIKGDG